MDISLEMVAFVVVLTVLGVLFTGPGMWSEKWGWKFLQRKRRGDRHPGSHRDDGPSR